METHFIAYSNQELQVFQPKFMHLFETPVAPPFPLTVGNKTHEVVPWGEDNLMPQKITEMVQTSPDLSSGLLLNIQIAYGDGIIPCRFVYNKKGEKSIEHVRDNKDINAFFRENDVNSYLLEQATDVNYFYNSFPELILNRQTPDSRKVVELNHKEATFSRWGKVDKETGKIEQHFYSSNWDQGVNSQLEDAEMTPVLDPRRPIADILERIGRRKYSNGRRRDERQYRYIVNLNFPTPGRTYYQRPYWYSIVESGWYDFAVMIPEFKKYMLQNGMTLKYIIYLSDDYFPDLFAREGITDEDKKSARIKQEYENFSKYLSGLKNTGKSMVSFTKTSPDGKKEYRVEIKPMENSFRGGEYLDDSSEVSNMIAYSLGVHPSLMGASPGRGNANLSGSEKRELFIIKQSLLKPIRDRLLLPLYIIKAVNKWPDDIEFTIPNIQLTTLDKNKTGVETGVQSGDTAGASTASAASTTSTSSAVSAAG